MKTFVIIFTAFIHLVCAALAFFMLLVGLNGFSEKDATASLIFYIVFALASAAGVGLASVYMTKRLADTSVGIYGAAAIAAVASVLFGIIIYNNRLVCSTFSGANNTRMEMSNERIETYSEFWDFYVAEHSEPLTRYLHFIGTTLSFVVLVWIIRNENWIYLPLCLIIGYAFAWFAHFFVEHNKPATFKYPFWSIVSDYKMVFYMLTGKMNAEVERVSRR